MPSYSHIQDIHCL
uniref:Uncharacterized protein n=1 Tax=Anguilla anguilla TaxID=7936 RepID=A0A0E9Y146_ANGAN